ncbi:FtsX-like permease family protein [Streptomyces sp. NPDC097619]|uniref:ABC transporter permease n=1 Tax=Streptomyces sp. NPDC097619 TaxID=3157228 RepID=UPI003318B8AF
MNLFKRAWWRLSAHLGKTAMLTGLFLVICTLVLSGFLIRSAAARAAGEAKRTVGAVATMQLDLDGLIASGKMDAPSGGQAGMIGAEGDLRRSLVDRVCRSSVVTKCNYTSDAAAFPGKKTRLHQPVPPPAGQDTLGTDLFKADGIRDLGEVAAFRNGDAKLVSGRGITPDSAADEIVVEERVAKANGIGVGDRVALMAGVLPGPGGERDTTEHSFKVVGVYRSGTPDTGRYVPAMTDPANQVYVTPDGASVLMGKGEGAEAVVKQATFTLKDPADLPRLKKDAEAAGADPRVFPLTVNDKQYRALVGPITRTADFATVTVWLVALAGTAILALVVASSLRERRKELGILLSLGERKPRLLGQHLVEVLACALLAIGLAAACSQALSQTVGDRLLAGEVADARNAGADRTPERDPSDPNGGTLPQEPAADPIDSMDVRLGPADIARVGATGLGIAALAVLLPGVRVLRLHPRDILTKGD